MHLSIIAYKFNEDSSNTEVYLMGQMQITFAILLNHILILQLSNTHKGKVKKLLLADVIFIYAMLEYRNLENADELSTSKIVIQVLSEIISIVCLLILFYYVIISISDQQNQQEYELKVLVHNKKFDNSLHKQILDSLQEGILITSRDGITYVN